MSRPKHSGSQTPFSRKSRRRRPAGVSRRQRRKNLGIESLEDRRVMSAQSPLDVYSVEMLQSESSTVSYSSATPEGQLATLLNEINRISQQLSANGVGERTNRSVPSDPLLADQWHLINTGQQVGSPDFQVIFGSPGEDINVAPVWNMGITGEGVVVAVIDSGVEFTHPDLDGNIDSTFQFDALTGDSDASPALISINAGNAHGTAVAGLIGAEANDEGGVGVAPGSQLVPIRLVDIGLNEATTVEAFRYRSDEIDITNNSWGPSDAVRSVDGPTPAEVFALRDSVIFGRNGLGTIHVWASGNGADSSYDFAGYDGFVNSRYTIGVTGVDHTGTYNNVDGTVTGYPEAGPSVLVAAPTGSVFLSVGNDTGIGSGLVTTDTTGDTGFNQDPDPDNGNQIDRDFLTDEAYTSRFNGTSAAAPVASGVIALMLEANPNLSWRDVQEILVRSARQNAKFDTLANGSDKARGVEYQSTWIINQVPLFHDPDIYDPLIPNTLQILNPTLDPTLNLADGLTTHYTPTPQVLTNSAGYTVSQGRGTNQEQIGYAHGVIDAELAVDLALQWSSKGQHLPDELSFTTATNTPFATNLPAAEVINPGGLNLIVPGGLGGGTGFGAYWNEYFAPVPNFAQQFPTRGQPQELTVPSPNDMTVENVEVTLNIAGGTGAALDNLRVVLVSPNGTHSELNHYFVDPAFAAVPDLHQADDPGLHPNGSNAVTDPSDYFDPGSIDNGGNLVFTFSTNRIWGERSDDALFFDPTTGEPVLPVLPGLGGNTYNAVDPSHGDLLTQGWQLHFENYGTTPLSVNSIETVWHGSPIGANTKRIQGLVGVDDNRDDLFNYSRVTQEVINLDGDDPSLNRLGEVQNIIDTTHESMASNVTVLAFRDANANGIIDSTDLLVDQFVTGADGNYYFDLVPDDYIIAIDDESLGDRTPLDDSLTPAGFLKNYQAQWTISSDFFQVWDYDANLDVPIDPATDAPFPFLDASGNTVEYHVNHINFLLDPGVPAAPEVVFNGQVIADLNGDGVFNGSDTVAPGILVYGDVNRNGQFDSGEAFTSTDASGNYSLTVPSSVTAVIEVGVQAPVDWQFTNPSSGSLEFFTQPGDTISNVNFAIQPPVAGTGIPGSAQPGTIFGFVFEDSNEDGERQASESGLSNVEVYIDNNLSGVLDAGDTVALTNSSGGYVFTDVPVGTHELRVALDTSTTLEQTFPIFGLPNTVIMTGEATISDVKFGFNNTASLDYGDLPDQYITLFNSLVHDDLTGGPRHPKGIFFLGTAIDAELNGQPTIDADGDDVTNVSDDDGIVVDPLVAGTFGRLEATASRHGGYLQGWVDFNGDGDFNDVIGGVSERIITNKLLDPGLNVIDTFRIPDTIDATTVYARFRYGEFGLGLTGLAQVGEVEDYVLPVAAPVTLVIPHGPDFDEDGDVDGADFLAWQRGYGIQVNALAGNGDANSDGAVDGSDLGILQGDFGQVAQAAQAVSAFTSSGSESVSGFQGLPALRGGSDLVAPLVSGLVDDEAAPGSPLLSHESGLLAATLGPRIDQPGFREDFIAGVIEVGGVLPATIASEFERLGSQATASPISLASDSEEFSFVNDDSNVELGLALRDLVFARRQEIQDEIVTLGNAEEEREALAVALGEEIEWRLN